MNTELLTAWAVLYVEKFGLSVIPMGRDKKPLIKWAELQSRRPSLEEIVGWKKENLAIVTGAISNLVVVDCESQEDAVWFHRERGQSPVVVKTKRGFHFYFRHPGGRVANAQRVDDKYDVRGDGGYVLAPPSTHSQGSYSWHKPLIPTDQLPVFDMAWRPHHHGHERTSGEIRNAVAYIATIRAVSGQCGHNETYRAACILRQSGLSEAEALVALQDWNQTNADPPWDTQQLLHKIKSAYA